MSKEMEGRIVISDLSGAKRAQSDLEMMVPLVVMNHDEQSGVDCEKKNLKSGQSRKSVVFASQ
jgi:hypothetical protein